MVSDNTTSCPYCHEVLAYYGRVKRIVKTEYGKTEWVYISRMVCTNCKTWHRMIPGYILPFKHYRASIINGFISGEYSNMDLQFEDYPSESTVRRWIQNSTDFDMTNS